jgi:hypothetical protein
MFPFNSYVLNDSARSPKNTGGTSFLPHLPHIPWFYVLTLIGQRRDIAVFIPDHNPVTAARFWVFIQISR